MKIYLIKYLTEHRGECYDTQTAANTLTAIDKHYECHPNSFAGRIKRHSDGSWLPFDSATD